MNHLNVVEDYLNKTASEKNYDLIRNFAHVAASKVKKDGPLKAQLAGAAGFDADLGEDRLHDKLIDLFFYKLDEVPADAAQELGDHVRREINLGSSPDTPSWFFMRYQERVQDQWLVHFTDSSFSVVKSGFDNAVNDVSKLGLTSYMSYHRSDRGYAFAYLPGDADKYGTSGRRGPKYGDEAVMFRAPGVKVWHHGDEEPQVIFWSESATDLVGVFQSDGGWVPNLADAPEGSFRKFSRLASWLRRNRDVESRVARRYALEG